MTIEDTVKEHASTGRIEDEIVSAIYDHADAIATDVVLRHTRNRVDWDDRIDSILTSKAFGYPVMLLVLALVFWITISGANYPSALLSKLLFGFEDRLTELLLRLHSPEWLHGVLVLGMYRTLAWVVSVMLPPMAIFFPLFTFLEDLGYLPRVAFNLDHWFKRAGAHGKQALTMSMGFGCNAAGVIAARVIESPRERLIAILTNSFVPCNGRFPALIALAATFVGGMSASLSNLIASATVVGLVIIGILVTLLISLALSKTILKGVPSAFTLELPPYRKPQLGRIIVRSLLDRTLFVLKRAVIVALPAGAVTWVVANTYIGGTSVLDIASGWLDPIGRMIGLDGVILLAFILGLPANEIVIPIALMSYLSTGMMIELDSASAMHEVFVSKGWTLITALNFMLFSVLHFPCGTTLLTIKSETGSFKWAAVTAGITTLTAFVVCWLVAQTANLIGGLL
ncbi:MAG TPA: nucleoside recognition domain-containing protein [Bacillota bacterium]|nr:nucleoside recognition domain-containing protein [Bacillota bacterium]HQD17425.1 nucleoside recognition domain-containing protein [Bacillota bacterium]